mmetsp:Transcript_72422/g.204742  ORF Transcript_72422/g.204742 Transcript_72422/m.204742 type:complete len:330 (+) Transcript_72422:155-1144(+)
MSSDGVGHRFPLSFALWGCVKPFATGSLAGCCSATVMTPVDIVKVRIQAQISGQGVGGGGVGGGLAKQQATGSGRMLSGRQIALGIWKSDGPSGFYQGISAVWMRQIIYKGAVLGLYDVFLSQVKRQAPDQKTPIWKSSLCATGAGGIAALVGNPTDKALVRMQTDRMLPAPERRNYRHAFHAMAGISREEGARGLFVGSGANAARAITLNVGFLAGNTTVKEFLSDFLDGHALTLVAALCAGALSCVTSSPADCVKIILQNQKPATVDGELRFPYKGPLDCTWKVLVNRGPLAFYTGFGTYVLKQAPMATLTLVFQDAMRRLWHSMGI